MKHPVTRKQYTSKYCFICGEKNVAGIQMRFYELDNDVVVGIFVGRQEHCSYPDRMHGGIISAILDETVGRAIEMKTPGTMGVTTNLQVKFRKPVPLGVELRAVGKLVEDKPRYFIGTGEILLPNGDIAATAIATYMKADMSTAFTQGAGDEEFLYHAQEGDKTEIDL